MKGPLSPRAYIMTSNALQSRLQHWLSLDACARYRSELGSPAEQAALRSRQAFTRLLFPDEFRPAQVPA